jgi:Ca2+-binding EF-hand superfamily protein
LFQLYSKFDDNGDGEIDFEEFVNGFNNMWYNVFLGN